MSHRRTFVKSIPYASEAVDSDGDGRSDARAQVNLREEGRIVHRRFPLNSEPRPPKLAAAFLTSNEDFYIRNHGTSPELSEEGYRVHVDVPGAAPLDLPVAELKRRFGARSITAVMQCAGNRRDDMGKFKSVSGDAWQVGAIGNAVWGGVSLADVLRAAGPLPSGDMHVAFCAHDDIEEEGEKFKYGVSIPLAKALSAETLLAFDMNGQALSPVHGFPVRMVVPGYAGVRSPKWLASIRVQERPSDNHIQQKEYKLFPPTVTRQTVDLSLGSFIDDMPLNAAILLPSEGAVIDSGPTRIDGYAIATRHRVDRVEVSADRGQSWHLATLDTHADAPWSWTPWSITLDLPEGPTVLTVRAFDAAGEGQPATPGPIWNYPGYLTRSWHRVALTAT